MNFTPSSAKVLRANGGKMFTKYDAETPRVGGSGGSSAHAGHTCTCEGQKLARRCLPNRVLLSSAVSVVGFGRRERNSFRFQFMPMQKRKIGRGKALTSIVRHIV